MAAYIQDVTLLAEVARGLELVNAAAYLEEDYKKLKRMEEV